MVNFWLSASPLLILLLLLLVTVIFITVVHGARVQHRTLTDDSEARCEWTIVYPFNCSSREWVSFNLCLTMLLMIVDFSKLCGFYYLEKGYKDITDIYGATSFLWNFRADAITRDFFVIYAPFQIPFLDFIFLAGRDECWGSVSHYSSDWMWTHSLSLPKVRIILNKL